MDTPIHTSSTTLDIFITTFCVNKMYKFWWARLKEVVNGAWATSTPEILRGPSKVSLGKRSSGWWCIWFTMSGLRHSNVKPAKTRQIWGIWYWAATSLVILLKLDLNRRLISPCDLEIWWMTSNNSKAPLLYLIYLCASFQTHRWIQTGVTVRKCSIWIKIGDFLSVMTLKFDGWPWKKKGTSSILHWALCIISNPSVKSNLSYSPETLNSGQNWRIFVPCDLEIWRMTLKNDKTPLVYSNWSYSPETSNSGKNRHFFLSCVTW